MAVPPCPLTLGYMVQVKGLRLYPPIGRLKADLAEWAVTGWTPPVGLVGFDGEDGEQPPAEGTGTKPRLVRN